MPTSILLSYKHSLTPASKERKKKNPQDFCVVFIEEHKRVKCFEKRRTEISTRINQVYAESVDEANSHFSLNSRLNMAMRMS